MKNTAALFEVVTTAQRNSIFSPSAGRLIWNSTTSTFEYFNGSQWVTLGSEGGESGPINAISQGDSSITITDAAEGGGGVVAYKVDNTVIATATASGFTFTMSPNAPTPTAGDSSTKVATTQFVTTAVAAGGNNSGANIPFAEAMIGGW